MLLALESTLCLVADVFAGDHTPIRVAEVSAPLGDTAINVAAAVASATTLMGSKTFTVSSTLPVRYQDSAPFGPDSAGTAWLVVGQFDFSGAKTERIPVNLLIDSMTGRLVAAYTDSTGAWPPVTAPGAEVTAAERCKMAGWKLAHEIPDTLHSTVPDVMSAVIRHDGVDPGNAGQMFLRPRWNTPRLPARTEGDKLVPLRGKEKVWIVQVFGVSDSVPAPPPGVDWRTTERLIEVMDGSLKRMSAVHVP